MLAKNPCFTYSERLRNFLTIEFLVKVLIELATTEVYTPILTWLLVAMFRVMNVHIVAPLLFTLLLRKS